MPRYNVQILKKIAERCLSLFSYILFLKNLHQMKMEACGVYIILLYIWCMKDLMNIILVICLHKVNWIYGFVECLIKFRTTKIWQHKNIFQLRPSFLRIDLFRPKQYKYVPIKSPALKKDTWHRDNKS